MELTFHLVRNYTRTIQLCENSEYILYGEAISALEMSKVDFSHLTHQDQYSLCEELDRTKEVLILYHPEIVASLNTEKEDSPYWGKNYEDAKKVFRREQSKLVVNKDEKRKIKSTVDLKDKKTRDKRYQTAKKLETMGYNKEFATMKLTEMHEKQGTGIYNLKISRLVELFEEFVE